jgi:cytochrome oxidase Cu insertion factor (SCO1/SenC/PrrC family)
MTAVRRAAAALLLLAAGAAPGAEAARPSRPPLNPGDATYTFTVAPFTADYEPPAAGSYELPVIERIADHALLDSSGAPTTLAALTRGHLAVVAFVYTSCAEATGCPLAGAIMHHLDRQLAEDQALAARVRLLTISFDPERDTPQRMATVRRAFSPKTDWAFLTTRDTAQLAPILDDFGQPVAKLSYEDGTWTGLFRHVLKVFLLDEQNRVRNIYSTGMMSPDLVMNDLRTLAAESPVARDSP